MKLTGKPLPTSVSSEQTNPLSFSLCLTIKQTLHKGAQLEICISSPTEYPELQTSERSSGFSLSGLSSKKHSWKEV